MKQETGSCIWDKYWHILDKYGHMNLPKLYHGQILGIIQGKGSYILGESKIHSEHMKLYLEQTQFLTDSVKLGLFYI